MVRGRAQVKIKDYKGPPCNYIYDQDVIGLCRLSVKTDGRFFCYNFDMAIVFAIGAGLILGSFLSVLIERWPGWQGVGRGRSRCPHCQHVLAWYDLVPLVSWAILAGRCRACKATISLSYPAMELVMASVFGILIWQTPLVDLETFGTLFMLFGFVALFFFDLRWMVLPDALLAPMAVVALLMQWSSLQTALPSALVMLVLFGVLYLLGRGRWLGLGDVKMAAVIGLFFSLRGALTITMVAIWAGAAVGLMLVVLGKATRKTALPFGAFWAMASIAAILWPVPFVALEHLFLGFL